MARKEIEFDSKTGEPVSPEFPDDIVEAKDAAKVGIATIVTPNGGRAVFPQHLAEGPEWMFQPDEGFVHDEG